MDNKIETRFGYQLPEGAKIELTNYSVSEGLTPDSDFKEELRWNYFMKLPTGVWKEIDCYEPHDSETIYDKTHAPKRFLLVYGHETIHLITPEGIEFHKIETR